MREHFPAEPFRIKVVEGLKQTSYDQRVRILKEAWYNMFTIKAEDCYIDFCTDSGVTAMSDNQWAALMRGDEAYCGCKNFFTLKDAVKDIFGFEYVLPAHQGRAAENVFFRGYDIRNKYVISNGNFDTTAAHIADKGGIPIDMTCAEGRDPGSTYPFKGNIDTGQLDAFIKEKGAGRIAMINLVLTCNNNGGQPVSMANIKEISKITKANGIKLYFDSARYAENAYFIQQREEGYASKSCLEIAREMYSHADLMTMSAKKTGMVNIGGLIACHDEALYQKLLEELIFYEGFFSYGGLAGRDLEAMAVGLYEGIDDNVLDDRVRQVAYFGQKLLDAGLPVHRPFGGHGVYLDALKLMPHIPGDQFPGETFLTLAYLEGGVRGLCFGRLAFGGRFDEDGKPIIPNFETIRYAVPRRMYTYRHIDTAADAIIRAFKKRESAKGLKIIYETKVLKHFLARFEAL